MSTTEIFKLDKRDIFDTQKNEMVAEGKKHRLMLFKLIEDIKQDNSLTFNFLPKEYREFYDKWKSYYFSDSHVNDKF